MGRTNATRKVNKRAVRAKTKSSRPGAKKSAAKKPTQRRAAARSAVRENRPSMEESHSARVSRTARILDRLHETYSDADCALIHRSALHLLLATILSAQSTDETVNKVTPVLFERYSTAEAIANASIEELEGIVHSTGFFRQKAKNIKEACRRIVADFGGEVPSTIDELITLPGVARKTANVVLGTWFGKNEGVVVDTHVGRLAFRLGLIERAKDTKDAARIETDLMEIVPQSDWTFWSHALIWHGRKVCTARQPRCSSCTLSDDCPSAAIES